MTNYDYNNLSETEVEQLSDYISFEIEELEKSEDLLSSIVMECENQTNYLEANTLRNYDKVLGGENSFNRLITLGRLLIEDNELFTEGNNSRKIGEVKLLQAVKHFHNKKEYDEDTIDIITEINSRIFSYIDKFQELIVSIKAMNMEFYELFFDKRNGVDTEKIVEQSTDVMKLLMPRIVSESDNSQSEIKRINKIMSDVNKKTALVREKALSIKNKEFYVKNSKAENNIFQKLPQQMIKIDEKIEESNELLIEATTLSIYNDKAIGDGKVIVEIKPIYDKLYENEQLSYGELISLMEYAIKLTSINEKIVEYTKIKDSLIDMYKTILEEASIIDKGITLLSKQETDYRHILK